MRLILASSSPRRATLLTAVGYTFEVRVADVDETPHPGETGEALVRRLAEVKARAVACAPGELILAADTTVVCEGVILNKPEDEADAAAMLRRLSGRPHEVYTGVTLRHGGGEESLVERTTVWFASLSEEEIAWYVGSGEPLGKAGGYGIQGRASRFVTRVDGSYPNVVGLPVAQVAKLLAKYVQPAS
ncbi:Maf family protein [Luteitalea sp.]|jgi:septum formation protein|uniref:Maf family protein n=1 Tax=Luteitalea sp. TaxID=2004800 RepID=UPI0037C8ABB7